MMSSIISEDSGGAKGGVIAIVVGFLAFIAIVCCVSFVRASERKRVSG